jgi:4-hydroxythreonine-4-phosphate dehydrogenase
MNIIITIGDCNGIGIEVLIKSIFKLNKYKERYRDCNISIAGNIQTIQEYSDILKYPVKFNNEGITIGDRFCKVLNCKTYSLVEFGKISIKAGELASEALELAVEHTITGEFDAIVTMPVSKESLYKAGWEYPGQTEMLAARCNVKTPLMILCSRTERVALLTIHIPIKSVPESISISSSHELIKIFNKSLINDFGINRPSIAVLGLNPHAGENGTIGKEEIEILKPAIDKCNLDGLNVQGPHPADGFFAHGDYRFYDGIMAVYHDQGLIPLKLLAKGAGVNFSAGLPIVRTSADHGTAFFIAGKDKADESSSLEAIEMAIEIAKNRKKAVRL